MVRRLLQLLSVVALVAAPPIGAQGTSMTLGGYIDGYFAWDLGRPALRERAFTSQARRHGEFTINLAYIDLDLTGDFVRGRIALQAGTSTTALTAAASSADGADTPALERHLQEAVVGLRLGDRTWVDAGLFFSHTGNESWITRDNITYTRSLIADLSPVRLAGIKLTRELRPNISASAVVANGWDGLVENNADKTVGIRADWQLTRSISLSYYNFIGNEQHDTLDARLRYHNGLAGTYAGSEFTISLAMDGGRQETGGEASSWWGASLRGRLQIMEDWAAHARLEAFQDPDRVITNSVAPFEVWGMSVGLDYEHTDGVTWRSEFRNLRGYSPIFEQYDGANGLSKLNYVFVMSLALTI